MAVDARWLRGHSGCVATKCQPMAYPRLTPMMPLTATILNIVVIGECL